MHPDVIKMCERDKDPTPVIHTRFSSVGIYASVKTDGYGCPVLIVGKIAIQGEKNIKRFADFLTGLGWINYDEMENEDSYNFVDRGEKVTVVAEITHYNSVRSDPCLWINSHGYTWSSSDGVAIAGLRSFVVKYFGPEKSE